MAEISINVERQTLSISYGEARVIQRGKNLEFWCLLLSVDGWVSVHDVHALPGWTSMTRESVGKQVARLIDQMRARQIDHIEWRLKTDGWRLRPTAWEKADQDTVEVARKLLEERRQELVGSFAAVEPHAMAGWALNAVSAAIAMTSGHAEKGYEALKASYAVTDNMDMHAIADVLATRIGQRFERPHAPVIGPIGAEASVFEMAVEARRLAAYAIRTDSSAWQTQVKVLQRLLPRLAGAAGFTTQAYVLNALALLLRRLGEHEQALSHVKEAVPLAVFSGDFTLIQSVLFNFGNIVSEVRRTSPGLVKDVDPLALLEMDLAIRKQFGLGKDSAQGELLLSYLAWEEGSLDRARGYLQTAQEIIAVSKVPADRALFHRVSGLVKIAEAAGKPCPEGIADLEMAIGLFDSIGNKASADYVREERERYAGVGPV